MNVMWCWKDGDRPFVFVGNKKPSKNTVIGNSLPYSEESYYVVFSNKNFQMVFGFLPQRHALHRIETIGVEEEDF